MDTQGNIKCVVELGYNIIDILSLFQYWENCRWADPGNEQDLKKIVADFHRAYNVHAKLCGCKIERLCEALRVVLVRGSQQTDLLDVDGDTIPMSNHGSQLVMKRASLHFPGSTESKLSGIVHAGHESLVQVLILTSSKNKFRLLYHS